MASAVPRLALQCDGVDIVTRAAVLAITQSVVAVGRHTIAVARCMSNLVVDAAAVGVVVVVVDVVVVVVAVAEW